MPVVVDFKSWTEKNKYTHEIVYKAVARVNVATPSREVVEENVAEVNRQHKALYAKVEEKLGRKISWVHDKKIISELNEHYAKQLRIACGRNPNDASYNVPLKSIDMVKAAYKLNLTPGSDEGWEKIVIEKIEEGIIK